jgi:hypothetical protein
MCLLPTFLFAICFMAQDANSNTGSTPQEQAGVDQQQSKTTIPVGTKVLLVMKNSVSSKNARPGDGVYLETTFPVVLNGQVVIPAGTYVQGVIDNVKRSGRIKGRAEILMHFTTLIYPNGYTVTLPGALQSADGNDSQQVKDEEGTVQADGTKGRDAATVATSAGTGGLIGGLSRGAKGAAIGGGIGAAVGIATAMLTRGEEVRLESGTSVEMVLQRPVQIETARIEARNYVPPAASAPQRNRKTDRPQLTIPNAGPIVR